MKWATGIAAMLVLLLLFGLWPLVKLVVLPELDQQRRIGGAQGLIEFMADDFDAPLEDFADYML